MVTIHSIRQQGKFFLQFLTIIFISFALNSCQKEAVVMKVGIAAAYPPFEFFQEDKIVGFDVDLINAIAKELGYEVKLQNMAFHDILPSLENKKIDLAISAINKSAEREQQFDFSKHYFQKQHSLVWLHRKGDPVFPAPQSHQKVGVQKGTVLEKLLIELHKDEHNFELLHFNSTPELIDKLSHKIIDIALVEKVEAIEIIQKMSSLAYQDSAHIIEGYAIAFPKGSTMVTQVNVALDKLEASGFVDQLKKKWVVEQKN